jgi:hypothetical protein
MIRDLRRHRRIRVPDPAQVSCVGLDTNLEGQITIISLGGFFVRTPVVFPRGTVFNVRIGDGRHEFKALCAVRDLQPDGIGMEFVHLPEQGAEDLKSIVRRFGG